MRLQFKTLVSSLRQVGLREGSVVMVQSSLKHIGPVEGADDRDEVSSFYYRALREVLGSSGTVLVHTPFEDYGRFQAPFDLQKSPSTAGILSQYVMGLEGAVRSAHPIVSVTGVGPMAQEICGGNHFSGFGWDSPWGRMHRQNVSFLTLGIGISLGVSFLHFVEAMYQVPYQYIKLYDAPVLRNGQSVEGNFTMSVRYLDFSIRYNFRKFEEFMLQHGMAMEQRFSRGLLCQYTTAQQVFDAGTACLQKNIFYFLENAPKFRHGEIPMDGATGQMQWVYDGPRKAG
jgi:aminoglycoside 3-N-acetyltransferase